MFSVVIPAYNRSQTISIALQSCQVQQFTDFEVIVVDDGSEDHEALKHVLARFQDLAVTYIRQPNSGASAARNRGIDVAKGEYIAFLDSDDQFVPDKLQVCAERLLRLPAKEQVVLFSQVWVDRGVGKLWVKPFRGPRDGEGLDEWLFCNRGFVQTSSLVVPRTLAAAVKWDERVTHSDDADFALRLASAGASVLMIEQPLVLWNDTRRKDRLSADLDLDRLLELSQRLRKLVSTRAYRAFRGWRVAKAAKSVKPFLAVQLYLVALLTWSFHPKIAVVAAAQVLLPRATYRLLADRVVWIAGRTR